MFVPVMQVLDFYSLCLVFSVSPAEFREVQGKGFITVIYTAK